MSLAPRCPQCRVPLRTTRLCVVCEAGIVVQRLEAVMPVPVLGPLLAPATPDQGAAAVAPVLRGQKPPVPQVEVRCDMPGCTHLASYHPDGLRRLQAKGQPTRCAACRQARRHTTTAQAWQRYQTKHHVSSTAV